jgi:hypothetical protein
MARPEALVMSAATEESLIPESSSIFSGRWISRSVHRWSRCGPGSGPGYGGCFRAGPGIRVVPGRLDDDQSHPFGKQILRELMNLVHHGTLGGGLLGCFAAGPGDAQARLRVPLGHVRAGTSFVENALSKSLTTVMLAKTAVAVSGTPPLPFSVRLLIDKSARGRGITC